MLTWIKLLCFLKLYGSKFKFPFEQYFWEKKLKHLHLKIIPSLLKTKLKNSKGYYMTAWRWAISLRVLENILRVSEAKEWNVFQHDQTSFSIRIENCVRALCWKFWEVYNFTKKYSVELHFWDISTLKMKFTVLMKSSNFAKRQLKSVNTVLFSRYNSHLVWE